MKKVLLLMAATVSGIACYANDENTFTIGEINYKVLSEENHTAALTGYVGEPISVEIPATVSLNGSDYSVTRIADRAFSNCISLADIALPESLVTIDDYAFNGCVNLSSAVIPHNVTYIGRQAFYSGQEPFLLYISPIKGLTIGEYAFPENSNINFYGEYYIGEGLYQSLYHSEPTVISFRGKYVIGERAFAGCTDLYFVALYDDSKIEESAFDGANVQFLYIYNCESIGANAFRNNKYLMTIWSFRPEPPVVEDINAFEGVSTDYFTVGNTQYNVRVLVPEEYAYKYTGSYGWSRFENYIPMGTLQIDFDPKDVHLGINDVTQVSYRSLTTSDYEITSHQWLSTDETVAYVNDNGQVTGVSSGMAMIYLYITDNYDMVGNQYGILVTVGDVDFSLSLTPEQSSIEAGQTASIATNYGGQGYTVTNEYWSSSNPEVAIVDNNGNVTGLTDGKAVISLLVYFDNELFATRECEISVYGGAGIEMVESEGSDLTPEYFTINGMRIEGGIQASGIYIKRQGDKTEKVFVR